MNNNLRQLIAQYSSKTSEFINQYKRHDVFRCTHESHSHFNGSVSVYHVLKVKKCYPKGCIYFRWMCKKLNRGDSCHKKYKHVGKSCFFCRFFYDIKETNRPEIMLSQDKFSKFLLDLKEFENWLDDLKNKLVRVSGEINSIKPRYSLMKSKYKYNIKLEGFLISFRNSSINTILFNDSIYVPINSALQDKHRFAKGDEVCFCGYFTIKEGTIVINKIREIDIARKVVPVFWTVSRALIAQRTGAVISRQSTQCQICDKGILLRVVSDYPDTKRTPRALFCLEGISEPERCLYRLKKYLTTNECLLAEHSCATTF